MNLETFVFIYFIYFRQLEEFIQNTVYSALIHSHLTVGWLFPLLRMRQLIRQEGIFLQMWIRCFMLLGVQNSLKPKPYWIFQSPLQKITYYLEKSMNENCINCYKTINEISYKLIQRETCLTSLISRCLIDTGLHLNF